MGVLATILHLEYAGKEGGKESAQQLTSHSKQIRLQTNFIAIGIFDTVVVIARASN